MEGEVGQVRGNEAKGSRLPDGRRSGGNTGIGSEGE